MLITHGLMSGKKDAITTGFTRLHDDDGVGMFTLEWVWSNGKPTVWHHYTYDRNPELYAIAKAYTQGLTITDLQ